ncbi:MAG: hypothetical protein K9M97_12020 [Akkermansiaceae bacterium]|nr:hypothetical protein [Akkermansiaceae bacterium]
MKSVLTTIACVAGGLVAGWWLPLPSPVHFTGSTSSDTMHSAGRSRLVRWQELCSLLASEDELANYRLQSATTLSGLLGSLRQASGFGSIDAERLVAMDPAAAMEQILNDPSLFAHAGYVAEAWARRDPQAAIRFLRQKTSYAAESCLCKALAVAYVSEPRLVGETLRAKGRRWQARNLEELFSQSSSMRLGPPPPPAKETDDPFANAGDESDYKTVRFGEKILDCLADDALREQARACWKRSDADDTPAEPKPDPPLDLANLSRDRQWTDSSWDKLRGLWKEHPEDTLAEVVAKGNYSARECLMDEYVAAFPNDPAKWPDGFIQLEESMAKLEVVPARPPSSMGNNCVLYGPVAADWIARQPLALQRAWSPTFTETWARGKPEEAIQWALGLPPGANGSLAAQRGLVVWAHREPLKAAGYVEALPPGGFREAAISNTAAVWWGVDPSGAKTWLATLPESPGKTRALERVN